MNCSNCGSPNSDTAKFCASCGNSLLTPEQQTPPMAPPANQQPMAAPPIATPGQMPSPPPTMNAGAAMQPQSKPYKAEFVMGLIGSIVGIIIFLIVLITSLAWTGFSYFGYGYGGGIVAAGIIGSIFILVSFILGFVGTSQVNKGNGKGGILLIVGGGLGFIAMFVAIVTAGWAGIFYYPLLLTAGIMALARRKKVESGMY